MMPVGSLEVSCFYCFALDLAKSGNTDWCYCDIAPPSLCDNYI